MIFYIFLILGSKINNNGTKNLINKLRSILPDLSYSNEICLNDCSLKLDKYENLNQLYKLLSGKSKNTFISCLSLINQNIDMDELIKYLNKKEKIEDSYNEFKLIHKFFSIPCKVIKHGNIKYLYLKKHINYLNIYFVYIDRNMSYNYYQLKLFN